MDNVVKILIAIAIVVAVITMLSSYLQTESPEERYSWLWEYPKTVKRPGGINSILFFPEGGFGSYFKSLPYDSVSLERQMYGKGSPAYTITLRRNGQASLNSVKSLMGPGYFSGHLWTMEYARLCCLIEDLGVQDLSPEYHRRSSHQPTVIVRFYRSGDPSPVEIQDYGNYGPIELWAIQQSIDGLVQRVYWDSEVKPSN